MKKIINLLPPEEQQQIRLESANHQVIRFGIWVLFSLLAMMVVLIVVQIFLSQTLRAVTDQVALQNEQLAKIQETSIQKQAEALNANLKNFQNVTAQDLKFSPYFIEFAKLLPSDVTLDTLTVNRDTGKVDAAGRAGRRESVLQLRQNILSSKLFRNINFPLDNLQSPRDVTWTYKFYLNTRQSK